MSDEHLFCEHLKYSPLSIVCKSRKFLRKSRKKNMFWWKMRENKFQRKLRNSGIL